MHGVVDEGQIILVHAGVRSAAAAETKAKWVIAIAKQTSGSRSSNFASFEATVAIRWTPCIAPELGGFSDRQAHYCLALPVYVVTGLIVELLMLKEA